jgi:multicomponent Na+:H+ antiporter subunit B
MRRNPIVREVADFTLPAILLVALYIQFHGEYSPGGGFQAGVVFGAGIWLYALVHGLERTQRVIPPWAVRTGVSLGMLLYVGVGLATMLLGGEFLNYDVLAGDHGEAASGDGHGSEAAGGHGGDHGNGEGHGGGHATHGQHWGILLIELAVGITVASVMVAVFYGFAARRGTWARTRPE